jgi:flagellar hook-associated protein 3 FlgL
MRISTSQIFTSGLNGILDGQAKTFGLQSQISSGKRVSTPGDDPVAASRISAVNNQLAVLAQYQKNADVADSRLQLEDETLSTIKDALDRLGELTIQAHNGWINCWAW